MTSTELDACRRADIAACDPDSLADLRDVEIDRSKPVQDRLRSFMEQVHNPYLFKVGDIVVKVNYGGERDFSEALAYILS